MIREVLDELSPRCNQLIQMQLVFLCENCKDLHVHQSVTWERLEAHIATMMN